MKILISFALIVFDIYVYTIICEFLRAKSNIQVLISFLIIVVLIAINYLIIKLILKK